MAGQRSRERDSQEERNKRQQRAERILDAAAELIQRWGYNKTTIDDIAKQAGVAKGTIYLHWKTREDLFWALLLREDLKVAEDIRQRMANDPEGATLHGMLKHTTLATLKNPLYKAVLLRDTNMLGELARKEDGTPAANERVSIVVSMIQLLREQGLIRTDLSVKELIYMYSAITMGFILIEPFMPQELLLSDEEAVEVMADALKRAFEPRTPAASSEIEIAAASQIINHYFEITVNSIKEQDQKEIQL